MSIGVLPTRSPMPIAAPCSRVAPASSAAIELITAKSRSRCPCQSMPTPPPHSSTTPAMKLDDGGRTGRRRVADRVGDAHPGGAGADRGRIKAAQRVGIGARRVFGHVHDRQPFADGEGNRLLGELQQLVDRPAFCVLAQWTGPDETAALDRHPDALRNFGDGLDVGDHGARRAVGLDLQLLVDDLTRQPLDILHDVRSGARQADVRRVDPQCVDQVQDLELLLDRRAAHRR